MLGREDAQMNGWVLGRFALFPQIYEWGAGLLARITPFDQGVFLLASQRPSFQASQHLQPFRPFDPLC